MSKISIFEIARQVDKLVMDIENMRCWREKIIWTFNRSEFKQITNEDSQGRKVWGQLLRNLVTEKDIDVLYTLLAYCHDDCLRDDCLRINNIITDEIKKKAPFVFGPLTMTVYLSDSKPDYLDLYLSYVERDLKRRPMKKAGE